MHSTIDDAPVREQLSNAIGRSSTMLQVVWQRKWHVVFGIVLGLVIGALAYARAKPVYVSSAQVLIIKKRTDVVPIPGGDTAQAFLEDYVSTHIGIIKSPLIIQRAVKNSKLESLKTFEGQNNPAAVIASDLGVARDAGGGGHRTIIDLKYQGPHPDETPIILNAVIDTYVDFLDGANSKISRETEDLFKKAQDLLHKNLKESEKQYEEFREKSLRENGLILWKGKDGVNVHQARLAEIETRKSALLMQKAELEGRLRAIKEAKEEGKSDIVFLPLASDGSKSSVLGGKSDARNIEEILLPLILEEEELLLHFAEEHPRVKALRTRIARTRQILDPTGTGQGSRSLLVSSPGKTEDQVANYVRAAKQELEQLKVSIQSLIHLSEAELEQAKVMKQYEEKDDKYRNEITRTTQIYDQTINRLKEINFVRDLGGGYNATVLAPPSHGSRLAMSLFRIFFIATGLGLLGGIGLAYLADMTDRSFRTPDEIRRSLGLTVMGHLPYTALSQKTSKSSALRNGHEGLSPALFVYHQPSSMEAEAYRTLRTALFFGLRGETHKVIQITSPNMGDGKTTLACNLAVVIAQSGKRVLLADADFRRPRVHRLFGVPSNLQGLTSVLTGEVPLADTIKATGINGLDILPCGTRPSNPAELLTAPDFERVLGEMRKDYDYVLIDTPPLLAVTDPCIVAGRVDGVLLTIRVSKNGRPTAERAKELLANIGVKVIGAAVNGVSRNGEDNGYGYRYYSYERYEYEYRSRDDHEKAKEVNGTAEKAEE